MIQLLLIFAVFALIGFGLGWVCAAIVFAAAVLLFCSAVYHGWLEQDADREGW